MADKAARLFAIQNMHAEIGQLVSKSTHQPKYDPRKVGIAGELDQYGLKKDHNVVLTCSDNNFDKAQTAGVVVEQHVYAAIPRIVDNMCHIATDEEILQAYASQREFFEQSDERERLQNLGPYKNGQGREVAERKVRHSPAFKVLDSEKPTQHRTLGKSESDTK